MKIYECNINQKQLNFENVSWYSIYKHFQHQCFLIRHKSAYEVCEETNARSNIRLRSSVLSVCLALLLWINSSLPFHFLTVKQNMKHQEINQTSLFHNLFLSFSHHLQPPAVLVPGAHKQLESPSSWGRSHKPTPRRTPWLAAHTLAQLGLCSLYGTIVGRRPRTRWPLGHHALLTGRGHKGTPCLHLALGDRSPGQQRVERARWEAGIGCWAWSWSWMED